MSISETVVHTSMRSTSGHFRFPDDLPITLLQLTTDLLPTCGESARLCMVCKTAWLWLEWRLASPLQVHEGMSGLSSADLGVRAVVRACVIPQRSSIFELSLGNNSMGNAGALEVSVLLTAGCTVRRLSLNDNAIGDEGAYALAAALALNMNLEELDLWDNITSLGKAALLAAAKCQVFVELEVPPTQPWAGLPDGTVRTVIFEWISRVQIGLLSVFGGKADTQDMLFRTFCFVDAYFAHMSSELLRADVFELQLIGAASTIAAIIQSTSAATRVSCQRSERLAAWLALVSDGAYTADDVKNKIHQVTMVLGFTMHTPTAYIFLCRCVKKTGLRHGEFSLANYLIELAVMNGSLWKFKPQAIAAAATVLSRQHF